MSSKKTKNNSTDSKEVSTRLKNKKSNGTRLDSPSNKESKSEIKFKKVKKISKSIKGIESEISHIQTQMKKIENDLNTILKFIETGKKT
jgi:septal ring factor EnvC (AmiA/AmiB activator)